MQFDNPRSMTAKLLVLVALGFLAGCGGRSGTPVRSNFVEFTQEQRLQIESESQRAYRIQTEDVLRIAVSNQKELYQEAVLVLPDGAVGLLEGGNLQVAGLTLAEADSAITAAYAMEIRNPDVSVIVIETKGKLVYVLGEVRSPGLQRLPKGGIGIVGAVTLAGGFTEDAAPEGTVLVRVTEEGYLAQEIDLSYFDQVEAASLASIGLQSYDVVYIPRSRIGDFGYFSREVLAGLVSITRLATDVRYLSTGKSRWF